MKSGDTSMHVVNWLALKLEPADIAGLTEFPGAVVAARKLRQKLVQVILQQYPWEERRDLVEVFYPGRRCQKGEWLGWIQIDRQRLRPPTWVVGRVIQVEEAHNPFQGNFQVITVEIQSKIYALIAGVSAGPQIEVDFSQLAPEQIESLVVQLADAYAGHLQSALEIQIQNGALPGRFVGETFIHNDQPVVPAEEFTPYFDALSPNKPWLTAAELFGALLTKEELQTLLDEDLLPLLRAALAASPYMALGADRWTRADLYSQLNREVPRGLPVPHIRSKLKIWTEADQLDLGDAGDAPIPEEVRQETAEDIFDEPMELPTPEWEPPDTPLRLPTLSYLHITQAYFPIRDVMQAFDPDLHLVMVQVIEGDRQPFVIDRHQRMLKALDIERLRTTFLNADIPAGAYLWLEYQGSDCYRIAPRPLLEPRQVPCKLAYMDAGRLVIEQTEIPMSCEGDPSVFKAELRFEDIEALFAEAERVQLSVLDAIIQSVQELCAADPRGCAHYRDIFNTVYLKRMCSPRSVVVLLYTKPCFVKVGDGLFRFTDNPWAESPQPAVKQRKRTRPRTDAPRARRSQIVVRRPVAFQPTAIHLPTAQDAPEHLPPGVPLASSEAVKGLQVLSPMPEIQATIPDPHPLPEQAIPDQGIPESDIQFDEPLTPDVDAVVADQSVLEPIATLAQASDQQTDHERQPAPTELLLSETPVDRKLDCIEQATATPVVVEIASGHEKPILGETVATEMDQSGADIPPGLEPAPELSQHEAPQPANIESFPPEIPVDREPVISSAPQPITTRARPKPSKTKSPIVTNQTVHKSSLSVQLWSRLWRSISMLGRFLRRKK